MLKFFAFFLEHRLSLDRGSGGFGGLGGLPAEGGAAAAEGRGDAGAEQQGQSLKNFFEFFFNHDINQSKIQRTSRNDALSLTAAMTIQNQATNSHLPAT